MLLMYLGIGPELNFAVLVEIDMGTCGNSAWTEQVGEAIGGGENRARKCCCRPLQQQDGLGVL